jgi:dUTP pyrophosphatase
MPINVTFKRFDKSLPLPEYKTSGAAGLDMYARETKTIQPGEIVLIPLNVAISVPEGYFVLLASRSSTYKMGIQCANGIGIGDYDYRGDNDEYMFPAYNFTDKPITIEKGERCSQILILPVNQVEITELDKLENPDRGGFGTTGKK